jgi:hypothetical protein
MLVEFGKEAASIRSLLHISLEPGIALEDENTYRDVLAGVRPAS